MDAQPTLRRPPGPRQSLLHLPVAAGSVWLGWHAATRPPGFDPRGLNAAQLQQMEFDGDIVRTADGDYVYNPEKARGFPGPWASVERVSKYFPEQEGAGGWTGRQGSFCVFRDVDLRIAKGELATLVGHSGCGKSTLLNIIAGFEQASTGGVILDGKEVTSPGLDRMVLFQSLALMPWLSAFDNVRLAVRAARPIWDKARVREETQRYLDMMGLKGAEYKKPAFLSGGMRQRVGLARAFAVQPKVLLLDQPFAQIDALTRGVIQEELVRMWMAMQHTVFMVTHGVDEAILLSDRIALMTNAPEARLAECVEVDIPRPRSRGTLIDTTEYTRLRSYIMHFLLRGSHALAARAM